MPTRAAVGGGGGGLTVVQPVAMWARTSGSAATSSASFSVTSGELLVIGICSNGNAPPSPTVSAGYTVTQRGSDSSYSQTRIFTAPVTSTTSITITLPSFAENGIGFVWQVSGQHASPIGVGSGGNSTTNNLTVNYTATAAGSITFVMANEWQELGTPTSSNMTNTVHGNYGGYSEGFAGRRANAASGATSFNLDAGGSGSANWSYSYVEILKA
jgi:hypothetical protein